jgi:hypothetical protein
MDPREKQILEEAATIKKRLREEECEKQKEEKKQRRLEKAEQKKVQKKKQDEQKKIKEEKFRIKKELFETTVLPTFEKELKVIDEEINTHEKLLNAAQSKKQKLKMDLEPLCVHTYGKEYTVHYGAYTYKDCIHCSYKECTREVSM